MEMSPILRPPDGCTSADMERDGWQRQVEQRHRSGLLWNHAYGRHHQPVQGCQECAFDIGVLLRSWYEPHKGVEELFR